MPHSSISLNDKKSRKKSIQYNIKDDLSLSYRQSKNGGFRRDAWTRGGDFRFPSAPRLRMRRVNEIAKYLVSEGAKYNSGYHEAAVPTDLFIYLRSFYNSLIKSVGTKDKLPETANLPSARPGSLIQRSYAGKKVYVHNVGIVGQLADAFRTDTAQTALSGPDGTATGHSGSDLDTKGQSSAHDLLRAAVLGILLINPNTERGLTLRSVSVLMGSIVVSSIAPGKLARSISTKSLKAGADAKENWEDIRNKSKERVHKCFNQLFDYERDFVTARSKMFLDSTNSSGARTRHLGTDSLGHKRSTSSFRSREGPPGEIKGGDYEPKYTQADYVEPPTKVEEWGFYMTHLFRGRQREAGDVQIDG